MGELGYGAGFVEWFAAEARRAWGETISSPYPSKRLLTIKQPIGVAGMITPVSSLHLSACQCVSNNTVEIKGKIFVFFT